MTNTETWRAVAGYDGAYEVSNLGHLRRTKTRRLLKPFKDNGAYRIDLTGVQGRRRHSVADLVAAAFLPAGPRGCVIGYRSDDVTDNSVGNLEWLTTSEHAARWFKRNGGRRRAPTGEFLSRVIEAVEVAAIHESQTEGWQ